MQTSRRYELLTGATGLVGSYLMRDLFMKGRNLVVIVRPTKRLTVEQRIESILQRWENQLGTRLPRPVIFEGNVCQPYLGLGSDEITWLGKHCDRLIHSAAVLQFDGADMADDPWKTNLGGTRNVLDVAKKAGISDFHYVSTAYVCGQREGPVFEHELDCAQEFRNDYERSKFQAESLVQAADHLRSKTIYRPAVIVGDSQTGYTSTYHGLFLYLRLLCTLVPQQQRNEHGVIETPIRLPMEGNEPRNLVPVDWVARVISHIFCSPEALGKTFHLVPDEFTTARDVIEYCYDYFNSSGVEFCGSSTDRAGDNEFAERYFENVRIYESYETSDPKFDKRNVEEFAGQFPCPAIDKDMILRFIEFGNSDRWGKQREKIPTVERWFDSELAKVASSASKIFKTLNSGSQTTLDRFGLDIRGTGGGQWQMIAGENGELRIAPGLPDDPFPVLTMNDQQANELLDESNPKDLLANGESCPFASWSEAIKSVLATPGVH